MSDLASMISEKRRELLTRALSPDEGPSLRDVGTSLMSALQTNKPYDTMLGERQATQQKRVTDQLGLLQSEQTLDMNEREFAVNKLKALENLAAPYLESVRDPKMRAQFMARLYEVDSQMPDHADVGTFHETAARVLDEMGVGPKPVIPEFEQVGNDLLAIHPLTGQVTVAHRAPFNPRSGVTLNMPGADASDSNARIAAELGVPATPYSPYRGMSTKEADKLRAASIKAFEKRVADQQGDLDAARSTIADLSRFLQLNETAETGGVLQNLPGAASAEQMLSPALKEMAAIAAKITPMMRQPGSGAVSDFDARMFQNSTVGTSKPYEVNRAIAMAAIAAAEMKLQRAEFEQRFFEANQTTNGAGRFWNEYVNANPIFDPSAADGEIRLNPDRMTFEEFFTGAQIPAEVEELSDEEIMRRLTRGGR